MMDMLLALWRHMKLAPVLSLRHKVLSNFHPWSIVIDISQGYTTSAVYWFSSPATDSISQVQLAYSINQLHYFIILFCILAVPNEILFTWSLLPLITYHHDPSHKLTNWFKWYQEVLMVPYHQMGTSETGSILLLVSISTVSRKESYLLLFQK
jgi:hypothetical protein